MSQVVEVMRGWLKQVCKPKVGKVRNGFGCCRKDGWAICPTHWEYQWKCDERLVTWWSREDDSKLGYVINIESDAVESITDIDLDELNWAKCGISEQDLSKNAIERVAKLHGVQCSQRECVGIDVPPAVVANPTWTSFTLGDHAGGRYAETREIMNRRVRQDDPLSLINHVDEFFLEETNIFMA